MKEETSAKNERTKVFNVVILDRSGSMGHIRKAAVSGFNETLASICKAQERFKDTQEHFITLVTFCSCQLRTVMDMVPAEDAHPLAMEDYEPCCTTPLYDAMGATISRIRSHVAGLEDFMVVVTIITDGLENASREYSWRDINALVDSQKAEGWTFTYMGANQDSMKVAESLAIRNWRNFDYSDEGAMSSMEKDSDARMELFRRHDVMMCEERMCCSERRDAGDMAERRKRRRMMYSRMADEVFDDEKAKES